MNGEIIEHARQCSVFDNSVMNAVSSLTGGGSEETNVRLFPDLELVPKQYSLIGMQRMQHASKLFAWRTKEAESPFRPNVVLVDDTQIIEKQLNEVIARTGLGVLHPHPQTSQYTFVDLTLKGAQLTGLGDIHMFRSLLTLDLRDNFIEDLTPLANLLYLLSLQISNNLVKQCLAYNPPICNADHPHSQGESMLGSTLAKADLSWNCISQLQNFSQHEFIEELSLAHNKIEHMEYIGAFSYLTLLDLSYNNLTSLRGIEGLSELRELYVDRNQLTDLKAIAELNHLNILSVSYNHVHSLNPLQGLSRLHALNLESNKVQQIKQVEHIQTCKWLRTVILQGNRCSQKPFYRQRVIARLQQLHMLDEAIVTPTEKVKATNLMGFEGCDLESRKQNFEKYFPGEEFVNYLPPFVDDELVLDCDDV